MMAVQAQYPANALAPDFRDRARTNTFEDLLQMQQFHLHRAGGGNEIAAASAANKRQHQVLNFNSATVFSDPQSELTCNASYPSKKRSRDDMMMMAMMPLTQANLASRFLAKPNKTEEVAAMPNININSVMLLSQEQRRMLESTGTSTSGRPALAAKICPPAVSPLPLEVVSCIYHQNTEIDALVRLESERLRAGLEEARKRHCRALLSVVEQRVAKKLKEKEAELDKVSRRNAELEEMVRQLSAEGQMWLNAARESEALVANLRSTLEHVLLQNAAQIKEGCGESDAGIGLPAGDAQSCCFNGDDSKERRRVTDQEETETVQRGGSSSRKACRVCQERDVCVLMLPCKHLCLCKDCESKLDTCPICHSAKKASLQIFMS